MFEILRNCYIVKISIIIILVAVVILIVIGASLRYKEGFALRAVTSSCPAAVASDGESDGMP